MRNEVSAKRNFAKTCRLATALSEGNLGISLVILGQINFTKYGQKCSNFSIKYSC